MIICSPAVFFKQTYLPFLVKDVAMELAVPLFGLAVGYKVHHGLFSRRVTRHHYVSFLGGVGQGVWLSHTALSQRTEVHITIIRTSQYRAAIVANDPQKWLLAINALFVVVSGIIKQKTGEKYFNYFLYFCRKNSSLYSRVLL